MTRLITTIYFALFLFLVGFSQSGQLDPSFASDGILLMDLDGGTDTPYDIVVQPDGKILVAGVGSFSGFDFAVVRLLEDGGVDTSFAENGVFHYENSNGSDLLYDLELLEDGSILLAGSYSQGPGNTDFFILKITGDGEIDTAFGEEGLAIIPIGDALDYAREMTITEHGKIAVCGYSNISGSSSKLDVLLLLNADGTLDSDFGEEGIFIWNDIGIPTRMFSITLAPDGHFLVSGVANTGGTDRIAVYKVLADGSSLDTTFGTNGEILAPVQGEGHSIQVHPNGNILVAGSSGNAVGEGDLLILAYDQAGNPNTNFGTDGMFLADVQAQDEGTDMVIQSDGKIIIVGESGEGVFGGIPPHFSTARCDADGILDMTWGGTGIVETITSDFFAFQGSVTVQPDDGKVLVAGATSAQGGNDFTVIRYGNFVDADEDGSPLGEDCDDSNSLIFPGNDETPYNGLDDDCDPATPDDDLDGDGFLLADDCDDTNPDVNPDNVEEPYNGLDDDCNTNTPDDDLDGDGFVLADDCDDTNAYINPDAEEIPNNEIDEDCDGEDSVTSVREFQLSQQFIVYPNPAEKSVFLEFEGADIQLYKISIVDVLGRQLRVINKGLNNNQVIIPLNDLPSGVLSLFIETNAGFAVKRIMKK